MHLGSAQYSLIWIGLLYNITENILLAAGNLFNPVKYKKETIL